MHAHDSIPLLVIALGAFVVPLVSGRIGIPAAVGEIIYGAALGPFALGLIAPTDATEFLGELGFAFLMFLAGLELEFAKIERQGARSVAAAFAVALAISANAAVMVWIAGLPPFLFVAIAAVSVGVALATLNETGQGRSLLGQTIMLIGSFGEFITIVSLTLFSYAFKYGVGFALATEVGKLVLILVVAYIVLIVLRTWIWWYPDSFSRVVATKDPAEIGVRAGMALMLVFVAFAAAMGVKAILGAFIAGALFSFVFREKGMLEAKMSSIGFGFFVPIFFIGVGTSFDIPSLLVPSVLPMLGVLLSLSLLSKLLAVAPLWKSLGLRGATGAGFLLATPLTLLVVIARVGRDVEAITTEMAGALVLLAVASSVILPPGFKWLVKQENSSS